MRLLYLVSHPIQYQAPLLRFISDDPNIHLKVLFENIDSVVSYYDTGFKTNISWDTDLTNGYEHHHVKSISEINVHLMKTDALWLHGWDTMLKRRALSSAWRLGVPVLMRGENTIFAMPDGKFVRGMIKRLYLRWVFNRCAGFLCIGSDNREYYLAHGVRQQQIFSMPYAIDNEAFSVDTRESEKTLRGFLRLEYGRPIILFAGKFLRRKNPGMLLEACRIMDREITRNPYLLFVGKGEAEQNLREIAGDLEWVRFMGFRNQSELPAIYAMADVFVLPSECEPWGLAVNEAMACGTAVISTDQCGCSADLIDDTVGRLIPAGDLMVLRAAIEEVLANRDRCSAMGRAARKRISSWGFAEDLGGLKEAITAVVASQHQS